jgi:uncharacterized membrane protein YgaE (UPF0421/DUF939 family)
MKIPTFEEAEMAIQAKTANPLEVVIYNYTPAGEVDEEQFRKEIAELVQWVEKSKTAKIEDENARLNKENFEQSELIDELEMRIESFNDRKA